MARLSRSTRETIKTITFVVIVAILVLIYIVYPLNRIKAQMGRENVDQYNPKDTIRAANDPSAFVAPDLTVDTFRIETDGLTKVACVHITRTGNSATPRGLVIVIPNERKDRSTIAPLARMLADSGFSVLAYDQRASGLSSSKYHGDGQYEATDLEAIIAYLDIRKQIIHPVIVVGYAAGADAGMLAAQEEKRIDRVVAIDPYLTSTRLLDQLKSQYGTFWFPFYRTIMWWWYNIRSSYAMNYRHTDDIKGVACRTIVMADPDTLAGPEISALKERSGSELLSVEPVSDSDSRLTEAVIALARP
ncbi:MAG TPA: alpha/beta fold hydrolase [Candidatus Acidoferrum sp.]|nr:alpha/beta fold hydrolase [Candidatus Acidoferrum sp.]